MARHRMRPVSEHGCHGAAVAGEALVADGVDATVDAVEAAGVYAVPDCARAEANQLQLTKADHPVLPRRKLADRRISRGSRKIRRYIRRFFRDPPSSNARSSTVHCCCKRLAAPPRPG